MIIGEVCLVIIALEALVLRKKLLRLTKLRFRHFWLVWLALIDQIVVISVLPDHPHFVLSVANFVSYLAAGLFVWSNRRIPGALVIGLGGACNVAVIASNGGEMPASETALRASGWKPLPGHFVNSGVVSHPKLAFLGDIFNTPRWIPGHTVFSIGDVVAVLGLAMLVYLTCARAPDEPAGPGDRIAALATGLAPTPDPSTVHAPGAPVRPPPSRTVMVVPHRPSGALGAPHQVVSASGSPASVRSPTQAT